MSLNRSLIVQTSFEKKGDTRKQFYVNLQSQQTHTNLIKNKIIKTYLVGAPSVNE